MRLYLSSQYWGNQPNKLFGLIDSNKKHVGIITNSTDLFPEEGTILRLNGDIDYLANNGFTSERLDLRDYFEQPEELKEKLNDFGLVWALGGNTFVLRRAMARSGFDTIIRELLAKDEIVYGGFSAGSCVAGATLHGIDIVDDIKSVPDGYTPEIIWDGLNFVTFAIAPHYKSDHPESSGIEKAVEYFQTNSISFKALRDGEALIVNNDKVELLQ